MASSDKAEQKVVAMMPALVMRDLWTGRGGEGRGWRDTNLATLIVRTVKTNN